MKKILLIALLALSANTFAQDKVNRKLGSWQITVDRVDHKAMVYAIHHDKSGYYLVTGGASSKIIDLTKKGDKFIEKGDTSGEYMMIIGKDLMFFDKLGVIHSWESRKID